MSLTQHQGWNTLDLGSGAPVYLLQLAAVSPPLVKLKPCIWSILKGICSTAPTPVCQGCLILQVLSSSVQINSKEHFLPLTLVFNTNLIHVSSGPGQLLCWSSLSLQIFLLLYWGSLLFLQWLDSSKYDRKKVQSSRQQLCVEKELKYFCQKYFSIPSIKEYKQFHVTSNWSKVWGSGV